MIPLSLFLLTIPAANFLIGNVGTSCLPDGPCLIPVGFGLVAPSGVLLVGAALALRDLVQQQLGAKWSLVAIAAGATLSASFAPATLVAASTAAFVLSELADFAVYTPLRKRGFIAAVAASSLVGLVVDSALFLWLAFGSLDFLAGQMLGKAWMAIAAIVVLQVARAASPKETGGGNA
ncbi:VUT family protein [Microvirga alba]|uniref:VUT family protein n=1 Tax=Microvirga alba TaxID=2791025 RepID=A0A931BUC3_9HYPH|nr:VUT family protein [Microvirga alba]MBF9233965.1 VUT family protein [Microvirga alba]